MVILCAFFMFDGSDFMNLIIAEKKLAAQAFIRALSPNFEEKDGYFEGSNGIVITWAQGHLLNYMEPGEINEQWEEWNLEDLPIIPKTIPKVPIKGLEKQLYLIGSLIQKSSVIINACDCAVEGEAIFHEIIHYHKDKRFNKPLYRLWYTSLEANAVRLAYDNLKPIGDYVNLARSALVRAKVDYLLGINTSRALTLVGDGRTLNMGRLIAAVLSIMQKREEQRSNFKETSYFTLKGFFKQEKAQFKATYFGERITTQEKLDEVLNFIEKNNAKLEYVDREIVKPPPLMLNHNDVLVLISKNYGLKPIETNKILENLYLKGFISYPRTSSRYVSKDEVQTLRATYRILREVYPNLAKDSEITNLNEKNDRLVNTISDHHAIVPTLSIATNLSKEEKWVYQLIVERFFLQTHKELKVKRRKVTIRYRPDIFFRSTSEIVLEGGWKAISLNFDHEEVEEAAPEEEPDELESVNRFQLLNKHKFVTAIKVETNTAVTKPISEYTEASLLKQMENVASLIIDAELKKQLKNCGIGTSATRAETLEKLIQIEYLVKEKTVLKLTPLALKVLEILNFEVAQQLLSPELTATWELSLKAIEEGKPSDEFEKANESFIISFIEHLVEQKMDFSDMAKHKCPECGASIVAKKKTFNCNDCDFFIWKTQYKKLITDKMLDDLLTKGETSMVTFQSKANTKYKAKLSKPIENGNAKIKFV
jgi:DNA topoisomerase III